MSSEATLGQAHRHATNAEEYTKEGHLGLAAEEHLKSAEAFQRCAEQSSDEGTKRTLKMLYDEHIRSEKDLQRRISKLREDGQNPAHQHLPQSIPPQNRHVGLRSTSPYDNARRPPYYSAPARSGYSSPQIEESYMVLGNQSEPHETFDRFWKSLEGMLDKLSQPVAFATAPLAQQTSLPENQSLGNKKSLQNRNKRTHKYNKNVAESFYEIEDTSDGEDEDSFFIVSSISDSDPSSKENETLKARISELETLLQNSEKMRLDQEEQLRERVEAARREAHRVKSSGVLPQRPPPLPLPLDLNPLNMALSGFSAPSQNKDVQLNRRIKELEDELKAVKLENEKQKATIIKFKERWEKLKDSAKKKRQAKLNTGIESNLTEQRIDEDPEAEAALES